MVSIDLLKQTTYLRIILFIIRKCKMKKIYKLNVLFQYLLKEGQQKNPQISNQLLFQV